MNATTDESISDAELLHRFVQERSEQAFRLLVERHSSMVRAVCARGLGGNPAQAKDAAQAVFIILARRAGKIRNRRALSGWLFRTAGFVTSNMRREERRRQRREQRMAVMMEREEQKRAQLPWWTGIEEHVNAAIAALGAPYREALVRYCLEGKAQKAIAMELDCSEEAVKKRVARGLAKVRARLLKHGVTLSAGALTACFSEGIAEAATAELAGSCHAAAMTATAGQASAAAVGGSQAIADGAMRMMTWLKVKVATVVVTGTVAVSGGTVAAVHTARVMMNAPQRPYAELRVIPAPREVARTPDQVLGATAIVLPKPAGTRHAIAAAEINARVAELGMDHLPVLTAGSDAERRFRGRRIVLSLARPDTTEPVPKQAQAYYIDSTGRREVKLIGRDEVGLLYAAVTFRHMLLRGNDDNAMLLGATIRDWPDFALRSIGVFYKLRRRQKEGNVFHAIRSGSGKTDTVIAEYLQDTKRNMDRIFRLKLNLAIGYPLRAYNLPNRPLVDSFEILVETIGNRRKAARFCKVLKEARDYGWARGIAWMEMFHGEIGNSPANDKDPLITRCAYHKSHKRYFCWTLDEHLRKRAVGCAKLLAMQGVRMPYVHANDGGGYTSPGGWGQRCKWCKQRWGDDHGAADAHVFGIWFDAFKKYMPEFEYFAIVPYPYNTRIVSTPGHPNYDDIMTYWRNLHAGMPNDPRIGFCIREQSRQNTLGYFDICKGRSILLWWDPNPYQWRPLFTGGHATLKTFYAPDRQCWMISPPPETPVARVAAAQYSWNTETSGALWFGDCQKIEHAGTEPKELFRTWLPRFAAEWYGDTVGDDLAAIHRGAISPSYVVYPGFVSARRAQAAGASRIKQQYEALKEGVAGIERVWRRIESGEKNVLKPYAEADFYGLSVQAGKLLAFASYNYARMEMEEGSRNMRPKREIALRLAGAIERVRKDNRIAARMAARTKDKPQSGQGALAREKTTVVMGPRYKKADFAAHDKQLMDLLAVLRGEVTERLEPPENRKTVRWLMRDGEGVKLGKHGISEHSLVSWPAHGGKGKAIQIDGFRTAWKDGVRVQFPPVDVSGYREKGGRLRFYVNGGLGGAHNFSFWLNARGPVGEQREVTKSLLHVRLANYVGVDGFEETWQLVDMPLKKLLREGHTEVFGFSMNYARDDRACGPLWIDSMYVCLPSKPVTQRVPLQERSARPAKTAQLQARHVKTRKFVGAEGTESRIVLPMRLTGDGKLTDVRLRVRVLDAANKPLADELFLRAAELRTPWWFEPLQLDLGREVDSATVETIIESREVKQTTKLSAVWN